jgi:hypothetical protein
MRCKTEYGCALIPWWLTRLTKPPGVRLVSVLAMPDARVSSISQVLGLVHLVEPVVGFVASMSGLNPTPVYAQMDPFQLQPFPSIKLEKG